MLYFIESKSKCTGCGACLSACPINCISFRFDSEGFPYPEADSRCTSCGKCKDVCPAMGSNRVGNTDASQFSQFSVAARHLDHKIWERSSSGGAFSAICEAWCRDGDAIFGAVFENGRIIHDCVYSPNDIGCFRQSKYVQSDLRDSFRKVESLLRGNRKVLFSGTPCQVAGLRNFLGSDYANLLCVDVICHGVASPGVFEKYLDYLATKYHSRVVSFTFRNKRIKMGRCREYIVAVEYESGIRLENSFDLFTMAFLQGLLLRPSCGECPFTTLDRVGDITIGDLKKRYDLVPEATGLENLSAIVVNTEKGASAFEAAKKFMVTWPVNTDKLARQNRPLAAPSKLNTNRDSFFHDLEAGISVDKVLKQYVVMPGPLTRMWLLLPDRLRVSLRRQIRWRRE